jgi:hypothetical protein
VNLADFKMLVASNDRRYRGVRPHSEQEFAAMEARIGYRFPESIRWLLSTHGYGDATGIDNLDESVAATLRCRQTIGLPANWLILNDWQDAGVVLLDLDSSRICWCDSNALPRSGTHQLPAAADWYGDFAEWSLFRLQQAMESGS